MYKGSNCDRKSQFSEILTKPLMRIMKYLSVEFLCKEYKSEKRSCSSAKKSREFISYLQNNSVEKKKQRKRTENFLNDPENFQIPFRKPEKIQISILSVTIPEFHFTEKFSRSLLLHNGFLFS